MKNSINTIAIALLSFSNIVIGANFEKKSNSIEPKNLIAKTICYANANLIEDEIASLSYAAKTVSDEINSDLKIVENELYNNAARLIISTEDDLSQIDLNNLIKSSKTIKDTIDIDLKITEMQEKVCNQPKLICFADSTLLEIEIAGL